MVSFRYFFVFSVLSMPLLGEPTRVRIPYKALMGLNYHYGAELCCPEIQHLVAEIQKELGMGDYKIEVRKFSEKGLKEGTPGLAFYKTHLFFVEEELLEMSRDEQRFLIGHELMHMRGNHIRKENILENLISYGGTILSLAAAILLYKEITARIYTFGDERAFEALKASSSVYLIGGCASVLLGTLSKRSLSRSYEAEADCYAAHELHCALGGCLFFLKRIYKSRKFSTETGSFNTHPTDFKRFINLLLISGDTTLYDLVNETDNKTKEEYMDDILVYLKEHVN